MEIFDFNIQSISGETLDLSSFKGKKMLLVNVASECGFTVQYAQLQELYEANKEQLIIIGLPCNDFGGQEPGTANEIQDFCKINYGVTFPITEKVGIINNTHPLYSWMAEQASKQGITNDVNWNFCKYLIDETGNVVGFHPSSVTPLDDQILQWLTK